MWIVFTWQAVKYLDILQLRHNQRQIIRSTEMILKLRSNAWHCVYSLKFLFKTMSCTGCKASITNTLSLTFLILKDKVRKILFIERKELYITNYNFKTEIWNILNSKCTMSTRIPFCLQTYFSPLITALRILGVGVHVIFNTLRPLILSVRMTDPPFVCISRQKLQFQLH